MGDNRLGKYFLRCTKGSLNGYIYKIIDKYCSFKKNEYERLLISEAAFLACPSSIHTHDDGMGLTYNHRTESQLFYIASPSKTDVTESGIRKTADPFVLDKMLDVVYEKNIDFTLTQVLYKMSSEEENKETNKELAKLDMIRDIEVKLKGRYSRWLDHQGEDIENFSKQSFDGLHRQFKQLLICRIDGTDRKEVDFNSTHLQTILRGHGVFTEVPYGGQLTALRASLASNEFVKNSVSKVMSNVAACMWPGRNPIRRLDYEGILLGFISMGGKINIPIFWNPENPAYNCKHLVIFGGSGKGKSTTLQYWLWNATGANCDWILFVPKEDFGTSHIDMIKALGGSLIKIEEGEHIFNPFMVFYNPETQGKELKDRKRAFIRHKESLINFFNMLIGTTFSPAMAGTITRLIKSLYVDAKVIDDHANPINIDNWLMGETWPSFSEMIIKTENWINDIDHRSERRSLEAIRGHLSKFESGEALSFLDNHDAFFPADPRMVIDVSGILKRYQDAITVLLVDLISTRLKTPSPEAYKAKKRTIIAFDEGANLLKMAGMADYIPRLLREARAGKCSIILDNQDPDGVKEILPILKTNTDAMIFFCDMSSTELTEFQKHFTFTDKDKKILQEKSPSDARQMYFVKNGLKLPILVKLNNTQKRVIFNEEISELLPVGTFVEPEYKLEPGLEIIRDEEGVMSDDWITERTDIDIPGFKRSGKFRPPSDDLSKVVWLDERRFTKEVIDGTELINGESADHWITNALMKGEYMRAGCTDLVIHHYGGQGEEDADITGITPDGKVLWTEYAHPGSRSIKQLEVQKNHQMAHCDIWMCVCQKDNKNDVEAAVGRDFYVMRGKEFRQFIQNFGRSKQRNGSSTAGQTEVQEA
jgi:hypothetical protein